jgi:hypothetical protein
MFSIDLSNFPLLTERRRLHGRYASYIASCLQAIRTTAGVLLPPHYYRTMEVWYLEPEGSKPCRITFLLSHFSTMTVLVDPRLFSGDSAPPGGFTMLI